MPYRVVRPFVYGANGIHGVALIVGDVRDDFGTATRGLLAERYIELIEAVASVVVEAQAEAEVVEADGAQVDNGSDDAAGDAAGSKAPRSRRRLRG